MQTFRKRVTHLWWFPGILLLIIPIFFFPTTKYGTSLFHAEGLSSIMILFLFLCISVAFTRGIGALTKLFFYKDRPIPMKFNTFWTKLQAGTFPSLHTIAVTIVAMVVFRGTVELGFSQYIFLVYMVVIVAVALSRIELKKHYPADVFFGVIYGIVGTFLSIFGSTVILARIFKIFNLDVY